MPMIHSSAHVDPHAQLADDVVVGPGAVIEDGVTVGRGCQLGPHAVLHRGTTLGADVYVAVGAALGGLPQDLKFTGGDSGVFVVTGRRFASTSRSTGASRLEPSPASVPIAC